MSRVTLPLTVEQAAIIGAYTGTLVGKFSDLQAYADRIMGRPTWTHEFGDQTFSEELKRLAKPDLLRISAISEEDRDAIRKRDEE